jgi:protein arginine N-methyltransferase 1
MHFAMLDQYSRMMKDHVRMEAYERAIKMTCGGKVVCEIGVGLGPLTIMALKAGAKRVYGIEGRPDVLAMATKIIRDNGFGPDRFIPIEGMSQEVSLPEKVDVVLSETLDSMGVGENTVLFMEDAKRRFLAPGGIFLPSRLDCYFAFCAPSRFDGEVGFWRADIKSDYGMNYDAIARMTESNVRMIEIEDGAEFHKWHKWRAIDFSNMSGGRHGAGLVRLERAGVVTGLGMAFVAELAPGVIIDTLPRAPLTHWKQALYPFTQPLQVSAGDVAYVEITTRDTGGLSVGLDVRIDHTDLAGEGKFLQDLRARLAS